MGGMDCFGYSLLEMEVSCLSCIYTVSNTEWSVNQAWDSEVQPQCKE